MSSSLDMIGGDPNVDPQANNLQVPDPELSEHLPIGVASEPIDGPLVASVVKFVISIFSVFQSSATATGGQPTVNSMVTIGPHIPLDIHLHLPTVEEHEKQLNDPLNLQPENKSPERGTDEK